MRFRATAPAKVNLYLHVVGKRPDGYHLLDSLFAFTEYGDVAEAFPSDGLSLEIKGPFAAGLPSSADNIVIKAALKLAEAAGIEPKARIVLQKNLPIASGIGGGSSDAAATLTVLQKLWGCPLSAERLSALALSLGADVPSCLNACPVHVSGVGEILDTVPGVPRMPILLVNPNKPVATPSVFKERSGAFSAPAPLSDEDFLPENFIPALKKRRNDLTESALKVEPEIKKVLDALEKCEFSILSRMSGSGGTCFALFEDEALMREAKAVLEKKYPSWWLRDTFFL